MNDHPSSPFFSPPYNKFTRTVLFIVGVVYSLLGVWCTILPYITAASLGFNFTGSGIVEYVVVYGGLELGLGIPMMLSAYNRSLFSGVYFMTTFFSLCLPLFRSVMIFLNGVSTTLLILFFVEIIIFLVLFCSSRYRATNPV